MLGVDSENPTGALGLYEGLGFEVYSRSAAYRRPTERPPAEAERPVGGRSSRQAQFAVAELTGQQPNRAVVVS